MKKSIAFISLLSVAIIGFQSCDKEDPRPEPITTTIDKSLSVNESCTFQLPENTTPKPYRIAELPLHSSISLVSKNANGTETYQYTSAQNFTGTDRVRVTNEPEEMCQGHHHGGKHHRRFGRHHKEDDDDVQLNIVIINFIINAASTKTSK